MKDPVIIIGMGEIGSVFARGILKTGRPVVPLVRGMELAQVAVDYPRPELVLCCVAENDLHAVLHDLPPVWYEKIALVQNELLPRDWLQYDLRPTVVSVWYEKKKGHDVKVLIPSPVHGRHAAVLVEALTALDIPAREVSDVADMEQELVLKNLYILTTNVCGLVTGGNVQDLVDNHLELAKNVASDVMRIQNHLTGKDFTVQQLWPGFLEAVAGDPQHQCMGRSAPQRLARALEIAVNAGLQVPALARIQAN